MTNESIASVLVIGSIGSARHLSAPRAAQDRARLAEFNRYFVSFCLQNEVERSWFEKLQEDEEIPVPGHIGRLLKVFGHLDSRFAFGSLADDKEIDKFQAEVKVHIENVIPKNENVESYVGRFQCVENFKSSFTVFESERKVIRHLAGLVKESRKRKQITQPSVPPKKKSVAANHLGAGSSKPGASIDLANEESMLLKGIDKAMPSEWQFRATKENMKPKVTLGSNNKVCGEVMCPYCKTYSKAYRSPYDKWVYNNFIRHIRLVHDPSNEKPKTVKARKDGGGSNTLDSYVSRSSSSGSTEENFR